VSRLSNRGAHPADWLTGREQQILAQLVEGKTNYQIALALGVSEKTVKQRLTMIYRKLGVFDRVSAAVWAVRQLEGGIVK
jgi:DNA-binding NarL/FixJ family response regulator